MSLPEFVTWINPVLTALRELGGTARPQEVVDRVAQAEHVADAILDRANQNGESRFTNQVHWARFYLVETGFLDRSQRGVWRLTEKGQSCGPLPEGELRTLYEQVQASTLNAPGRGRRRAQGVTGPLVSQLGGPPDGAVSLPPEADGEDHRQRLLDIMKGLSPGGFERLCQRLLREAGFEEVIVTGRSGDGGIDGHGVLALNAFVTFRVLFQCKRYEGMVTPAQVRDFRGALQGRADKGLILTTGSFTTEARREGARDGAPPIELIDGEKLVSLFEDLELGLMPRRAFNVNEVFFEEYRI